MTDANKPEEQEVLRAEAAAWFVRVQSDAATEHDWLALEAWLTASPARREAFDRVERLWSELDDAKVEVAATATPSSPAVVIDLASRRRPARPAVPAWRGWAVAASLAALLFVGWLVKSSGPAAVVFATEKGETRTILLADGSRLQLNSGSRAVVRVDRAYRKVSLDSGEAIFDVAKDTAHPFVVSVGDRRVTVVGTEFDILRGPGRVAVTVSRGVVEVRPVKAGGGGAGKLHAGDQLVQLDGAVSSTVARAPVEDVFAWRNGYVVYRRQTLADVAVDLNRFFRTPISVDGPAAQLTFSGALMIDDEDAVVRRLQNFLPITADRTPGRITLRLR